MHRAAGPVENATPQRATAWRRGAGYLRAVLARGGATALDLLLPPQCPACGLIVMREVGLCAACWRAMPWIERPYCERLGTPFPVDWGGALLSPAAVADPPVFQRARAVALFDETARTLVHRLKYGDRLELARALGTMMARAGSE
ncbi:MAG: double zinc ribbon domain-containing protein, partial [Pseudomonadota bacterium]|nr:double zinc ribbon domain-containing protein [Pseudomonadota bacterium]